MDISQCLNPDCLEPNPREFDICQRCGSKLVLGDRYRAVSILGKGGMGRTFLAVDEHRLNTPCVIKQFLPLIAGSDLPKFINLFKQEAICLRDLGKHPQIPDLEAFFEQESRFYLIQEFVDGQDLFQELKQKGKFSEAKAKHVFLQLLPVLHFIHSQNVIHRDIKPSNIIRRRDTSLVLIDFGVSKQISGEVQTSIGTVTGTVGYAPPEQMRGVVFPCSDLYALAATCVRLMTASFTKFDGTDELYDPLEGCWRWRSQAVVSPGFAHILDKLLNSVVKERYQSAGEVWQALNPKPAPSPVAPEPTPSESSPRASETRISRTSQYRSGIRSSQPVVNLVSEVGIDYIKLKTLLSDKEYKQADQETYRLMLQITQREVEGWLRSEDIERFPCADLKTLDQLWIEYTKRRFGFSIQAKIYQTLADEAKNPRKLWLSFCQKVGWKVDSKWLKYDDLVFGLHGPSGHLPCGAPPTDLAGGMIQFELGGNFVVASVISSLVERLKQCT